MSNNHWIIDKVVAAGNRTLAWSSLNDHGPPSSTALLYRFLEELESGGAYEKEAAEICPRGARCAGTPKPPDEPFTCMSDDCPLKEARIRRAKNSDPQLLTRRCVKCGKRVGPGARTDVPGDGLPSDCQCDDPSLGTVPVTECPPPKMPERERDGVPGSRLVVKLDEAVACAEYWRDCARGWKEEAEDQRTRTKVQRDEATDAKDSLRKLQDRVADRDRTLEQFVAVIKRYQASGRELWSLFPNHPLPSDEIERLELIVRQKLLVPKKEVVFPQVVEALLDAPGLDGAIRTIRMAAAGHVSIENSALFQVAQAVEWLRALPRDVTMLKMEGRSKWLSVAPVRALLRAVRHGSVADIDAAWNGLPDAWKEEAKKEEAKTP